MGLGRLELGRMVDVPLGIDAQQIAPEAERHGQRIGGDPFTRDKNHVCREPGKFVLQQEADHLWVTLALMIRQKDHVVARRQLRSEPLQMLTPVQG